MDAFDLAILFTAAGALVGAGLVKTLISAAKNMGLLPDHGRGLLYTALALSAALIGLALIDNPLFDDGVQGGDILIIVLAIFNVYAASVGIHETAAKTQRALAGETNPQGPDPD